MFEESVLPYLKPVEGGFLNQYALQNAPGAGSDPSSAVEKFQYGPKQLLNQVGQGVDYDFLHEINDDILSGPDEVRIDGELGVVDLMSSNSVNSNLDGRYALLAMLVEDGETVAYFGKNSHTLPKYNDDPTTYGGSWGPQLAASYSALNNLFKIEPEEITCSDAISLNNKSMEEDIRMNTANYTEADARSDLKMLEDAFHRLKHEKVNSVIEFEDEEIAKVGDEHPFNRNSKGPRGDKAARHFSDRFRSLYNAGIIDYTTNVNPAEDSKGDAELYIREDIDDSIRTINEFLREGQKVNQRVIDSIVANRF